MKKLIAILAVSALVTAAAFADFDINWGLGGRDNIQNNSDLGFTDGFMSRDYYEDSFFNGSGFVTMGVLELEVWGNVNGEWLLNPNDVYTFSLSGLGDARNISLMLGSGDLRGYLRNEYLVNDGYAEDDDLFVDGITLTGQDVMDITNLPEGTPIDLVSFFYSAIGEDVTDPSGGSYSLMFSVTSPQDESEDDAEVPEPATYAYAAMGLVSLIGMKRRIKK